MTHDFAYSLATVLAFPVVTQMLAPSKATPTGRPPTLNVPRVTPSLARSFVTVPLAVSSAGASVDRQPYRLKHPSGPTS
jgi:hypothetical protein